MTDLVVMTDAEVAEYAGISPIMVRKAWRANKLRGCLFPHGLDGKPAYRFRQSEVEKWARRGPLREKKRREERAALSASGFVYVIQMASGPIKVGTSTSPHGRIHGLRTGNPEKLTLVRVLTGGRLRERELHRALAEHRLEGEWFAAAALALIPEE